ncbi:MAG: NAD(P)-dependent oxidoreductase [Pseudomonadota bacterium]
MSERLAVIGLGRMGAALAAKASAEGWAVTGWTRSAGDASVASEAGYDLAGTLVEAVAAADIAFLSLYDDAAVIDILGQLAAMDLSGKMIVDTSTVAPSVSRDAEGSIIAAGGRLLDAPISGGPEMVIAGSMGLFIGGADEDVARLMPVIQTLSDRIVHVGALGDGEAMKVVNNMAIAGSMGAYIDAVRVGVRTGLDFEAMLNVLERSPASNPMLRDRLPIVRGDEDRVGFSVDAALTDGALFTAIARSVGVEPVALGRFLAESFDVSKAGDGGKDVAVTLSRLKNEA